MKNKKGFTIIETLAVVVLIGIIGTIIISNLSQNKKVVQEKSHEREVEKAISSAALYIDSDENITNLLYLSDNRVTFTIGELIDSGLLSDDILKDGGLTRETKLVAELDENENIQFDLGGNYKTFIRLTPVKERLVVQENDSKNLIASDKVQFCVITDNKEECHEYKYGSYEYSTSLEVKPNESKNAIGEITNPDKYVFDVPGNYTIKYTFKANGETITRYKYYEVLSNSCVIKLKTVGNNVITEITPNIIFSNSKTINYDIESTSGTLFYVSTNNSLTGQEVKSTLKSGSIDLPENKDSVVYLYCFDNNSNEVGKVEIPIKVDTQAPTCSPLVEEGTKGNKYDDSHYYYLSNVNLSAKKGEQYKDNYLDYTVAKIDKNPSTNVVYKDNITIDTMVKESVAPEQYLNDNQLYYLHVSDAAGNQCTSNPINFRIDKVKPVMTFKEPIKKTFYENDNVDLYSLVGKISDVGSGPVTTPKIGLDPNKNIPEMNIKYLSGNTKYKVIYNIEDTAGNKNTYYYPATEPNSPEEIIIEYRNLAETLRNTKTCTGANKADCYVYNAKADYNYVSYDNKIYRAYLVTGSNYTRLISTKSIAYREKSIVRSNITSRCCNGGCNPDGEICMYKYMIALAGIPEYYMEHYTTTLQKYYDALSAIKTNMFPAVNYNNGAADQGVVYFTSPVGEITLSEYQKIACNGGLNCSRTYLSFGDRYWTLTPYTKRTLGSLKYGSNVRWSDIISSNVAAYYIIGANGALELDHTRTNKYNVDNRSIDINAVYYHRGEANVRPVLSAAPKTHIISGDGTINNPYVIGYKN